MNTENFRNNSHWITGEVHDVIINEDGTRTELPVTHNLVVDNCSVLIASLFKSNAEHPENGIMKWVIGGEAEGEAASGTQWTDGEGKPISPKESDVGLLHPIYAHDIAYDNIEFVTREGEGNDAIYVKSDTATNMLRVTVTIPTHEANGTWYEFGLFGGNGELMINHKIHEGIVKSANLQIQRTIIFTF